MSELESKIIMLQNLQQNISDMISLNKFDQHKYLEAVALIVQLSSEIRKCNIAKKYSH